MKDEYVSTEHLLLALSAEPGRAESARVLQGRGITRDRILEALQAIRGSQRVTDQNPRASTRRSSATAATSRNSPAPAGSTR